MENARCGSAGACGIGGGASGGRDFCARRAGIARFGWRRGEQERSIRWSSEGRPAEQSQATVTLAEALVAQTGSVFVSAACGGRAASVVAPVHVVVASVQQLLPDLGAAFARLRERGSRGKQLHALPDHGAEPHGGHRENHRDGRAWAAPRGCDSIARSTFLTDCGR